MNIMSIKAVVCAVEVSFFAHAKVASGFVCKYPLLAFISQINIRTRRTKPRHNISTSPRVTWGIKPLFRQFINSQNTCSSEVAIKF